MELPQYLSYYIYFEYNNEDKNFQRDKYFNFV